ncbi:tRNA pseudouridine13 synthase [Thermosulfidibacter takaii ABI70S6]|uniref:tRNA pseudouridine13 synthase n=1 Tax=Thermosulfidibacter takaii (strain DSM 17441 / JCM 13301 / NBRC 103674 / ABI70S6) TaxID=1298851 RepID=A0A0S3QVX9_THET7|nr:tRNA pseudouridine(13) synthase TruD [Thermosulfidibacter takaii]BAT72476.1 tRNA pseudouridine13 synthase [Thermosulfidibacter takaii ABI70S6]
MDILKQKIKQNYQDFVVEEVFKPELSPKGDFSYYKLEKVGRNTLDVLSEISRTWKIPLSHLGFSGLKDKKAVTTQYISIKHGPPKNLKGKGWKLHYIGKGTRGIEIGEAEGNRFIITIREVDSKRIAYNLEVIKEIGFANYFGEQRFLSDLNTKQPIAKYLLNGDFESALREYYTQSNNPFLRKRLRKLWGKWKLFLEEAKHLSHQERVAILVLQRTRDYEKAFKALPKNLKLMFLFSYQSLLWNRALSQIISQGPHIKAPFIKKEKLNFYTSKSDIRKELENIELPYISREALKDIDNPYKSILIETIEKEGLAEKLDAEIAGLKVFNPGTRKAIVYPKDLEILHQTKNSITIRFFLPSGSYATILIRKALFLK